MAQSRSRKTRPPKGHPSTPKPGGPDSRAPSLTPGRLWVYRLLALALLPLLLLGIAELGLRLAGYGHPTSFFLESKDSDGVRIIPNEDFGLLFFPPEQTRTPTPLSFRRDKPEGAYRIFLLGESAALGDPRPAYGFGRYLQALLETRFPNGRFEVIPAAMTAINSHALRAVARECRAYQADLWILYVGNNEMGGPFGAVTVFGPQTPPMPVIRASLALRSTRLGQWLTTTLRRATQPPEPPDLWRGLEMFLEQQLPPDSPKRAVVHQHYRKNLQAIVRAGLNSGAQVLLCTVAGNLTDCPPFASMHSTGFESAHTNEFASLVRQGLTAQAEGQWPDSLQRFELAQALDPAYAELRYRQGLSALAMTDLPLARAHLQSALDHDALPFRTDSALNQIIRQIARKWEPRGALLLDAEAILNRELPAGSNLFLDHVHFTLAGNDLVARLLAQTIAPLLPPALLAQAQPEFAPPTVIEERLGLTDWNRLRVLESMLQRFQNPPFTHQPNHQARNDTFARRIAELRNELHPRRYLDTEEIYHAAIDRHPDDPRLHENFAEFLEATDNLEAAIESWQRVAELLPHHYAAFFQQGRLLSRLGRLDDALAALQQSLNLRPNLEEARLETAQILHRQQKHEEAIALYEQIRKRHPNHARLLRHLADPLAALGRRDEATQALRQAAKLQPDFVEARYLLGVELGLVSEFEAAREEFAAVVQLRPNFILARINLGVACVRTGRFEEAREQFDQVLQLDPANATAQQHRQNLEKLLRRSQPRP
jgi:tetratricopeptide (TPR) repeat protein